MKSSKVEMKGKKLSELNRMSVLTLMALTLTAGNTALALSKGDKLWHIDGSKGLVASFAVPPEKTEAKEAEALKLFEEQKYADFIKKWTKEPLAMLDAVKTVIVSKIEGDGPVDEEDKRLLEEAFLSDSVKEAYGKTSKKDGRFEPYKAIIEKMLVLTKKDLEEGKYLDFLSETLRRELLVDVNEPEKEKPTGEKEGGEKSKIVYCPVPNDGSKAVEGKLKAIEDMVAKLAAANANKPTAEAAQIAQPQPEPQQEERRDPFQDVRDLFANAGRAINDRLARLGDQGENNNNVPPSTPPAPALAAQQPQQEQQTDEQPFTPPSQIQPQETPQIGAAPSRLTENTPQGQFAMATAPNARRLRSTIQADADEIDARNKSEESNISMLTSSVNALASGMMNPIGLAFQGSQLMATAVMGRSTLANQLEGWKNQMRDYNDRIANYEDKLEGMKKKALADGADAALNNMQLEKSRLEKDIAQLKANPAGQQALALRQSELDAVTERIQLEQKNMTAAIRAREPEFEAVAKQLEEARKAGNEMKSKISGAESKIASYQNLENSIRTALATAQGAAAGTPATTRLQNLTSGTTRGPRGNAPTMPSGTQRLPLGAGATRK